MRKRTSNSSIDTATIKKQHRTEAVRLVRMTTRQGIEEPCEGKLSSTVLKTSQQGRPAGLVQQDGRIDIEKLRAVWVKALLGEKREDELICMAVDSSVIERPDAQTSQDRGIIHLSNLPPAAKSIGIGWTFSTVVLLPEEPCSWAPILDQQRIPTEQTPVKVAIAQLQALKPLLGKRRVLLLADRGYCTPEFLRACRELGISVIVRMKSDRRLYRSPVRLCKKGPPPKDGPNRHQAKEG